MARIIQNTVLSTPVKVGGESADQRINTLTICNTETSAAVSVDLYLEDRGDSTSKTYILNNTIIPNGATLMLEGSDILYSYDDYDLYIVESTGGSRSVSIIIN